MLRRGVVFLLLLSAGRLAWACDDSGRVEFYEAKNGVVYMSYNGEDSNSAFLYGSDFHMAEEEGGKESTHLYFWLSNNLYQLQSVSRVLYSRGPRELSDEENLRAHFLYEYGYIKEMGEKGVVRLGKVENYGIVNFEGGDKRKRNFYIWGAEVNGGLQQFVTTSTSKGVQMLSVIVADGNFYKSKPTLDKYMYSYRALRGKDCEQPT